jgi:transcriptional regulator with XRE-family HTH domain
MTREAFGPNLKRARQQRRIRLEQIVVSTQIPQDLLDELERGDFSRWPTGIYARAYVRQYAEAIGLDPDRVVGEFCRWFPEGDRRAEPVIRAQAEMVGHELAWRDEESLGRRAADSPPLDLLPPGPTPAVATWAGLLRRILHPIR